MKKSWCRWLSLALSLVLMTCMTAVFPACAAEASAETAATPASAVAPSVSTSATKYGDVNGDGKINTTDALLTLRCAVKKITFTAEQTVLGDVDGSGAINTTDALWILRRAVNKVDHFPVEETPAELSPDTVLQNSLTASSAFSGTLDYASGITTAATVYRISSASLNSMTKMMIMSLQGIVAKTKAQIFISFSYTAPWEETLQDSYGITFVDVNDPWELVSKFKDQLADNGYVRYVDAGTASDANQTTSANVACTVAGVEKWLIIEDSISDRAKELGLVQKFDATQYDQYEIFWGSKTTGFAGYKDRVNKKVTVSLKPEDAIGRDLGIALGAYFWRDNELDEFAAALEYLGPNGIILGWHASEGSGVANGDYYGWSTVASDNAHNYSLYAGLPRVNYEKLSTAKYEVKDSNSKHYVAMQMSDGDNIMWLETGFVQNEKYFASPKRGSIPFGWTMSASVQEFQPQLVDYLYSHCTVNDCFMTAFSGLGYSHMDLYGQNLENRDAAISTFTKQTAEHMATYGQRYVSAVFMNPASEGTAQFNKVLTAYASQSQIQGGFVFYQSNNYCGSNPGAIHWVNGKPFLNARRALWLPEGNWTAAQKVAMIEETAWTLNSSSTDSSKIDAYTLINVHPWSFYYDDCVDMVSLLDDDVVVVTPDELLDIIREKVAKTDVTSLAAVTPTPNERPTLGSSIDETVYHYSRALLLPASTQLSYNFEGDTQGWIPLVGTRALDTAYYTGSGVQFIGSLFGAAPTNDVVNASIYNKITLPAGVTSLKYVTQNTTTTATGRVAIIQEGDTQPTFVTGWKLLGGNKTITANISAFAGKTVLIYIQFRDGDGNGSNAAIDSVEIN